MAADSESWYTRDGPPHQAVKDVIGWGPPSFFPSPAVDVTGGDTEGHCPDTGMFTAEQGICKLEPHPQPNSLIDSRLNYAQ